MLERVTFNRTVSGVLNVVSALGLGEAIEELAAGLPEGVDGAGLDRLQQSLELAEGLLDRIEIGAVRRQVDQNATGPAGAACPAGPLLFDGKTEASNEFALRSGYNAALTLRRLPVA